MASAFQILNTSTANRPDPGIIMDNSKEVMSRLKFIGRLQKGEKINVKHMLIQPDSFMTAISRWLIYPDNKRNTQAFVEHTIALSFQIIEANCKSESTYLTDMCLHLIKDLGAARVGIVNLKETYSNDVKFCCDLDTMLQDIDAKLHGLCADTNLMEKKGPDIDL